MRPSRRSGPADGLAGPTATAVPPADGSYQALDHMANWVRFADTKATILTAGLGVVLTMLMTNGKTIILAMHKGCLAASVTGSLSALSLVAVVYTLFWLLRAIGPQRSVSSKKINRFAWPTLVDVTRRDLMTHATTVSANEDAWEQVLDLTNLANRKFHACSRAVGGFAALVLVGIACVVAAIDFAG